MDRKEKMKKIWDVTIFGVVFVAAMATGLLIAFTIYKVIPIQYSVVGLIISFGLTIGGLIAYWKKSKKDDTP